MKYTIDMSSILTMFKQVGASLNPRFVLDLTPEEVIKNLSKGIDVDAEDIDWSKNCFMFKGKVVFLHIKDHSKVKYANLSNPKLMNRYHFWKCSTINDMTNRGRGNRYVASRVVEPLFLIDTKYKSNDRRKLQVCWNCITSSKIRQTLGKKYITHDDILKFMENKEVQIKTSNHKSQYAAATGYSDDWKRLSFSLRDNSNWTCSMCQVVIPRKYSFCLDVHHINGIKEDNDLSNLKVLCKVCHAHQLNHEHMMQDSSYKQNRQIIKALRKNQNKHL